MDINSVGKRITERRKSIRMTQEAIVELTGISISQLSNIENGHSVPSLRTLIKLSMALKVTPDYFVLGEIKNEQDGYLSSILQMILLCNERQKRIIHGIIMLIQQEEYN